MPSNIRLKRRAVKHGQRGQVIILGALVMAVLLFSVVILSYTSAQYQRNPTLENVIEVVSNVKLSISKTLSASVAYYASVIQVSGNRSYAQNLAVDLLEDGLKRLGSLFAEWNPSFTVQAAPIFATTWFEPSSFTRGHLNISFDLGKLGLSGVNYDADVMLKAVVYKINTTESWVVLNVTGDYGRPVSGLSAANFRFYIYNYTLEEWTLQPPEAETQYYYDGTYLVPFPTGVNMSAVNMTGVTPVLVQVMDTRGIAVTASSFKEITYQLNWDTFMYAGLNEVFPIELLQNGTMRWLSKNYPWNMSLGKELVRDTNGKIFHDPFISFTNGTSWYVGNSSSGGNVTASGGLLQITGMSNVSGVPRQFFIVTNRSYDLSQGAVFEIDQRVPDNIQWNDMNDPNKSFSIIFYISNSTITTQDPASLADTNWLAVSINVIGATKSNDRGIQYNILKMNSTVWSSNVQKNNPESVRWKIIVNATDYVVGIWLDAEPGNKLTVPFTLNFSKGYFYNVLSIKDNTANKTVTSDYNKVYASENITIMCLENGQTITLFDTTDSSVLSQSANSSGVAVLDFSGEDWPSRPPYRKLVYQAYTTVQNDSFYDDIWGGDVYSWQDTLNRTQSQTTLLWQPIPPIAVKQLHVNATLFGETESREVIFQVEDWASQYVMPLGMTVNTTIFSKNQMIVFLINPNVKNVTVWWNGSDATEQTSFAYLCRYFIDDIYTTPATFNNGNITLKTWLSTSEAINLTFSPSGAANDTGTVYPIRFNSLRGELGAQRATAVIYNGVVRDIIQYEAVWPETGIAEFPNLYSQIVVTLPANATYFTWTTRIVAVGVDASVINRTITDLSVMNLTVPAANNTRTEKGVNGTSDLPLVSSQPGNYTNTASRGMTLHLFSEYYNTTGGEWGAGVMYTDATLRKLYFFDPIANASVGGLSVWNTTSPYIDVDPVIANLTTGVTNSTILNQALDISWTGAIVVIDTSRGYPHVYSPTQPPSGLWVMVHHPPTMTVEVEG